MRKHNVGQTTVEFALVAVLFFGLLFTIFDFAILFYVNLTMQHAVREGTRYAIAGQVDLGNNRRSALIQKIINSSNGLYEKNLTPYDGPGMQNYNNPAISVIKAGNVTFTNFTGTQTIGDPGKANEIIIVRLTYSWPLMTPIIKLCFPNGRYTFNVKATAKNEPF